MQYILKMFILATILASGLVRAEDAYLALTIITPNEVEVYVDGTLNSKYSDATVIPIAPGPHRISFKGNGYQTEYWDISPRDGATLSKDVKLVPIVIRDGGGGSDSTLTKLVVKLSAQVQALQQQISVLETKVTTIDARRKVFSGSASFVYGACTNVNNPCSINISAAGYTTTPDCTITTRSLDGTGYTEHMVIKEISVNELLIWRGLYYQPNGTTMVVYYVCVGM